MPLALLNNILEATFRANPNYELVLFDRLPPAEQVVLRGLQQDPDFYGLLCSRERTDLGFKSVCQDTALLYLTLTKPGRLPSYIKNLFGDKCNQAIAELVLDGVLEIDSHETFVSGPQAYHLIYSESLPSEAGGTIAGQSIEALKYAQALDISHSQKLSARLYAYGRQPLSPDWQRRLPTPDAVADYLGIYSKGSLRSLLAQNWESSSGSYPNDPWLRWTHRHEQHIALADSEPTYKLYVSPAGEVMRGALDATVEGISQSRATSFKVGGDVYGLLRPDKIVVYFCSFDDLHEASSQLSDRLDGCPAHGVPFTAEIAGNGLLSWGIDPPRDQQIRDWHGPESWRLWVTNRLAVALLKAKAAPSDVVEPWRFAIDRLRLEGVDTQSWTPTPAIWREGLLLGNG